MEEGRVKMKCPICGRESSVLRPGEKIAELGASGVFTCVSGIADASGLKASVPGTWVDCPKHGKVDP